jgi:hypothetical protein
MEDRDRTYHTIWFVIVIAALGALNIYQFRQANTERGELRARISELYDESQRVNDEASEATFTIADREERFRLQAAACARLINALEEEATVSGNAIANVITGEWSAAQLEDWAIGEAQYQATLNFFRGQNIAGCGMRERDRGVDAPSLFKPVTRAWIEGAEPIEA